MESSISMPNAVGCSVGNLSTHELLRVVATRFGGDAVSIQFVPNTSSLSSTTEIGNIVEVPKAFEVGTPAKKDVPAQKPVSRTAHAWALSGQPRTPRKTGGCGCRMKPGI
jgi:hypothetical protein